MSRYKIVHTTGFKYEADVAASYNEARLLPVRDDRQIVFSTKLDIEPHGSSHEYFDYFKTRTLMFEVLEPHRELTITATTNVELRNPMPETPTLDWPSMAALVVSSLELTDAVAQTKRTSPPADLVRFAKRIAKTNSPHETALAVCAKVFSDMTYRHGVTGVHSIATEAWNNKIGVCQDFAHITLGALRAVGIPARYVSGYLHPSKQPQIGETVTGESHAWVEWWAGKWFAYDPTNDVHVLERHVVIGRARDYDDLPPLRGVYAGPHQSELFVSVQITKEG
ncbi:transglutaminase family protein [Rhodoluna sp.]|uniref:transglutaminase family protein n=1 Tax=Rhodoluna sp. TaxID=1969481 RepID=UPI0025D0ED07|nr:transglutaminase family protein [Rhodoluna sp.]